MIAVGSGAGDCGGGCGGVVGGPRDQTAGTGGGGGGGGVGQLLHRQAALNDSWPGTSLTSCGAAQALDELRCCCSPTRNSLHLRIPNLSLGYVRQFES